MTTIADPEPLRDPETGLLPLRLIGDEVLMAKAAEVTVFDDDLARLVDEMFRTMYGAPGVGLAGPQVGVGLRVFTWDCAGSRGHICNPVLETVPGELQDDDEGCLSVPGLYYPTARAMEARISGVDCDGNPVRAEGRGLLARCFQHETDHLDGRLYISRLGGRTLKQATKEMKEADWWGTYVKPVNEAPPETDPAAPPAE